MLRTFHFKENCVMWMVRRGGSCLLSVLGMKLETDVIRASLLGRGTKAGARMLHAHDSYDMSPCAWWVWVSQEVQANTVRGSSKVSQPAVVCPFFSTASRRQAREHHLGRGAVGWPHIPGRLWWSSGIERKHGPRALGCLFTDLLQSSWPLLCFCPGFESLSMLRDMPSAGPARFCTGHLLAASFRSQCLLWLRSGNTSCGLVLGQPVSCL